MSTTRQLPVPAGGSPARAGGYQPELRRTLGLKDLVVYGLVFMVPIAPMGIFGSVFSSSGGMVALAYVIGMVAMLFTAASYAQMVKAFPLAGSVYNYAGRGIGAPVGFLAGWAILLDYLLVPSLLYLIASGAMHATVPAIPVWLWYVGFVLFNTLVNLFGIKMTARITMLMLAGEVIVLVIFLAAAALALLEGRGHGSVWSPFYNPSTFTSAGGVRVGVGGGAVVPGLRRHLDAGRRRTAAAPQQIGRAMLAALAVAGGLFIAQTWFAALLVPDPAGLLAAGDPDGVAFFDAARVAAGPWLATLTAVATAVAWGVANSMVAQVATSRLLFAMARDRQLPGFLRKVSIKHGVPANAIVLTAVLSVVIGLYMAWRSDGIALLSSLINFGALCAFLVLHVAVVWHYVIRKKSRNLVSHLLLPAAGFAILMYVVINANVAAQRLALIWLGVGVVVLIGLYAAGRRPTLSGMSTSTTKDAA